MVQKLGARQLWARWRLEVSRIGNLEAAHTLKQHPLRERRSDTFVEYEEERRQSDS
jgi:hypothetical protein